LDDIEHMAISTADSSDPYAVDKAACRGRQARLLARLAEIGVDLAVLTSRESIQWLTGAFVKYPFDPVATITSNGHLTLIVPDRQLDQPVAADELLGYEAKWHSTTRDDQRAASAQILKNVLPVGPKRVAIEFASFSPELSFVLASAAGPTDVGPTMFQLRRKKDPDELAMLRRANEANQAMYEVGRQMIRAGVNELDVYSELYAAAVRALGEAPTYIGQDFQSNARGGAPRNRAAEAGELYILDLGVGFRGYYSDNARTIAVGGEPSAAQRRAWQAVADIFPMVQQTLRPGTNCHELFDTVQKTLDAYLPWKFNSHLGHGVGLAPQEGPHLNPFWDDTLEAGDYLAVEPGLYHEELQSGLRLEQNYLVTPDGCELLTPWPLELC
jgi:Xaa-Pro aminopeptidase